MSPRLNLGLWRLTNGAIKAFLELWRLTIEP
jgi:hypothetical protein